MNFVFLRLNTALTHVVFLYISQRVNFPRVYGANILRVRGANNYLRCTMNNKVRVGAHVTVATENSMENPQPTAMEISTSDTPTPWLLNRRFRLSRTARFCGNLKKQQKRK